MRKKHRMMGISLMLFLVCAMMGGCGKEEGGGQTTPTGTVEGEVAKGVEPETAPTATPGATPMPTPAKEEKEGSGAASFPEIFWRLAPIKYEMNDEIVMGYDIRDFGVEPDSGEDVTNKIQVAITLLNRAGGGTLFLPEGQYTVNGTLNVPKGVTICGDWQSPDESGKVVGTVLLAYSGRGRKGGTPFITLQPNSCLRNLTIWYPEQVVEDIVEYPPTVRLYDPTVWGADYTHVKNVTFVNSYTAVQQGPNGSGCPNVRNVYGTPLSVGLTMDGIADIGRFDYVKFAPDYWKKSGLLGAPKENSKVLRDYLYNNAIGITAGRVDWSYFTFTEITGYSIGFQLREGELNEQGNYPNGQIFRNTYRDCKVGVWVDGVASVGEALAEISVENCEIGIRTVKNEGNKDGCIQVFASAIDATQYAVYQEGYGEINLLGTTVANGQIYAGNGSLLFTGCHIETAQPQLVLEDRSSGAVLNGTTFAQELKVDNKAACLVSVNEEAADISEYRPAGDCAEPESKVARRELYVAELDGSDLEDVTERLQALLDQAAKEGGGIVFLPPGEYRLVGGVTVPGGVELRGAVDVGRNPIRLGTIFRIRSVVGEQTPAITLEANSGLRGIVFDYPEQDFGSPREYPYTVRGAGENIFIVNVSLRGAFNGVDLLTNRCDGHYVEYLSGICMDNVIQVGAGAKDGKIYNTQINFIIISAGDESKFGTWDNSPTGDTKEADQQKVSKYLQDHLVVLRIGNVENELLFDNFSYNGVVGVQFIEEDGKGASGCCIGQGVDYSSRAFEFLKLGDMQFVNTQVVSYRNSYTETKEICYLVTRDVFDGEAVFYNISGWGSAGLVHDAKIEGGTLRLYNARFHAPDPSVFVAKDGRGILMNLSYSDGTDIRIAGENLENLFITGMNLQKGLFNQSGFGKLTGICKKNARYAAPDETLGGAAGGVFLYTESFVNYPVTNSTGAPDALQATDNISEFQTPSAEAYAGIIREGENSYLRLHCDEAATQTYIKTSAIAPSSTENGGIYSLEMRLRLSDFSAGGASCLFTSMKGYADGGEAGSELLYSFDKDRVLRVQGEEIASWAMGEWYYLVVEFDLSKEGSRGYVVKLYDGDKNQVGVSGKAVLRDGFQTGNLTMASWQTGVVGGMEPGSGETNIDIDYIVGY